MSNSSKFKIDNGTNGPIELFVEPEGFVVTLAPGDHVVVLDRFEHEPLTIRVDQDAGVNVISIWPGDGDTRVEKDGVDVLDPA